jgi:hypothetical protein
LALAKKSFQLQDALANKSVLAIADRDNVVSAYPKVKFMGLRVLNDDFNVFVNPQSRKFGEQLSWFFRMPHK